MLSSMMICHDKRNLDSWCSLVRWWGICWLRTEATPMGDIWKRKNKLLPKKSLGFKTNLVWADHSLPNMPSCKIPRKIHQPNWGMIFELPIPSSLSSFSQTLSNQISVDSTASSYQCSNAPLWSRLPRARSAFHVGTRSWDASETSHPHSGHVSMWGQDPVQKTWCFWWMGKHFNFFHARVRRKVRVFSPLCGGVSWAWHSETYQKWDVSWTLWVLLWVLLTRLLKSKMWPISIHMRVLSSNSWKSAFVKKCIGCIFRMLRNLESSSFYSAIVPSKNQYLLLWSSFAFGAVYFCTSSIGEWVDRCNEFPKQHNMATHLRYVGQLGTSIPTWTNPTVRQ